MTDLPSSCELRSQLVTTSSGHRYAPASVRAIAKHKLRAQELGIISYAKHFGDLMRTETWERLLRYKGEFPPPPQPPNSSKEYPHSIGKTITHILDSNFSVNVMTDITPEIIWQLPILPINQGNFLPNKAGLYFVCASTTEAQVIYLGKTQQLRERWKHKTHRTNCQSESEKIKSAAIQDELIFLEKLGLDLYIRWLVLDATNEALTIWQNYAVKALKPFFLTREVYDETTLCWDAN